MRKVRTSTALQMCDAAPVIYADGIIPPQIFADSVHIVYYRLEPGVEDGEPVCVKKQAGTIIFTQAGFQRALCQFRGEVRDALMEERGLLAGVN